MGRWARGVGRPVSDEETHAALVLPSKWTSGTGQWRQGRRFASAGPWHWADAGTRTRPLRGLEWASARGRGWRHGEVGLNEAADAKTAGHGTKNAEGSCHKRAPCNQGAHSSPHIHTHQHTSSAHTPSAHTHPHAHLRARTSTDTCTLLHPDPQRTRPHAPAVSPLPAPGAAADPSSPTVAAPPNTTSVGTGKADVEARGHPSLEAWFRSSNEGTAGHARNHTQGRHTRQTSVGAADRRSRGTQWSIRASKSCRDHH